MVICARVFLCVSMYLGLNILLCGTTTAIGDGRISVFSSQNSLTESKRVDSLKFSPNRQTHPGSVEDEDAKVPTERKMKRRRTAVIQNTSSSLRRKNTTRLEPSVTHQHKEKSQTKNDTEYHRHTVASQRRQETILPALGDQSADKVIQEQQPHAHLRHLVTTSRFAKPARLLDGALQTSFNREGNGNEEIERLSSVEDNSVNNSEQNNTDDDTTSTSGLDQVQRENEIATPYNCSEESFAFEDTWLDTILFSPVVWVVALVFVLVIQLQIIILFIVLCCRRFSVREKTENQMFRPDQDVMESSDVLVAALGDAHRPSITSPFVDSIDEVDSPNTPRKSAGGVKPFRDRTNKKTRLEAGGGKDGKKSPLYANDKHRMSTTGALAPPQRNGTKKNSDFSSSDELANLRESGSINSKKNRAETVEHDHSSDQSLIVDVSEAAISEDGTSLQRTKTMTIGGRRASVIKRPLPRPEQPKQSNELQNNRPDKDDDELTLSATSDDAKKAQQINSDNPQVTDSGLQREKHSAAVPSLVAVAPVITPTSALFDSKKKTLSGATLPPSSPHRMPATAAPVAPDIESCARGAGGRRVSQTALNDLSLTDDDFELSSSGGGTGGSAAAASAAVAGQLAINSTFADFGNCTPALDSNGAKTNTDIKTPSLSTSGEPENDHTCRLESSYFHDL